MKTKRERTCARKRISLWAFALLFFYSCSWEQTMPDNPGIGTQTRGLIYVQIAENQSADAEASDAVKTVRFIVFTDIAWSPKAELNEFYDVAGQPSGSQTVVGVSTVLEVSRKTNAPNDKLVVAIVNEPAGMTGVLSAVTTPVELADLELEMAHFVADDHLSLKPGAAMTMSGAVWTDKVYETVAQAQADQEKIILERAVARVEVYMNTELSDGLQIAGNSYISLSNTFTRSYFVRHEDNSGNVLGNIQTVASGDLAERLWMISEQLDVPYKTPVNPGLPSSVHVCTFYTPERNCLVDKLMLEMSIAIPDGTIRNGVILLEKASNAQQGEQPVDIVRRNSIYRVTATIKAGGITAEVMKWNCVPGDYPIPEQYGLTVDKSSLAFPFTGGAQTVTVSTDHPDGWIISDMTKLPAGITASKSGNTVHVTAAPNNLYGAAFAGSFTIKAGNLHKTITVTQSPLKKVSGDFAGSNIYWDGSKLTFEEENTHEQYQGVYFRYGSLIGIAPTPTGALTAPPKVYIPSYNSTIPIASSWDQSKKMDDAMCTTSHSPSTGNWPVHANWAYFYNGNWDAGDTGTNYPSYWINKKGDICKYLGATGAAPVGYRMPTAAELFNGSSKPSTNQNQPWNRNVDGYAPWPEGSHATWTGVATLKDNGTALIPTGAKSNFRDNVFLPASGFRTASGAISTSTSAAGIRGVYLTSDGEAKGSNASTAKLLDFTNSGAQNWIIFNGGFARYYAMPVRCIKE